jgi:dihydroorotate dehydrogenase electron transfer subunit
MTAMIDQDVEIVFNKKLTRETFLMGLRSPEFVSEARPGQFVMIKVRPGDDPLLRRPFSICATRGDDLVLILYQVVGYGTALMSKIMGGERMSVLGPLGRGFELPMEGKESLLVAGGIGVAPLIFLAQTIDTRNMSFMAGYRSDNAAVPMKEVLLRGIDISIATDDGTAGHSGPVTELLHSHLDRGSHRDLTIFACGPLAMLKRVAELTVDRGIPCQVSLETTMACGLGACQGCAIKTAPGERKPYYQVCQDGPVFPVHSLDWKSLSVTSL